MGVEPLAIQFVGDLSYDRSATVGPLSVRSDQARIDALLTRVLDIGVAIVALIVLAPVMLIVSLLVFASDGGPIFFRQERIGVGGRTFSCFKFRSMMVDAEARLAELLAGDPLARREWEHDHKLRRDPRITTIGGFLRRSSLDELPQLFNVLRCEMSIVGPRPIVAKEAERYGRYFVDYCSTRPGITGLWQVSGRNDTTYRRRVALDVTYARSRSVLMDLRILARTIPAVLTSRGSY